MSTSVRERMTVLAEQLEAMGNQAGAAEVRADIAALDTPRPVARVYCDACRTQVHSQSQRDKYDRLGVDWVLCVKCERAA